MNRFLTALACLTLLLSSIPFSSAQMQSPEVSITCDQSIQEFTDSLTNQSIEVVCEVGNPTSYQQKISFSSTSSEFGVEAEDILLGPNQQMNVSITLTSIERVGKLTISSAMITATVVEVNGTPPPSIATESSSIAIHQGLYATNQCTTVATSNHEYIVMELAEMQNGAFIGNITLQLNHSEAPIQASNFALLSEMGCYDNVSFHRVIQGFMIQSGDFTNGDGSGGHAASWQGYCNGQQSTNQSGCAPLSWTLPDETNNLTHTPYVLSMAKTSAPNTAGSQFFIVSPGSTPSHLDGVHTVFGSVYSGFSIVDYIDAVQTGGSQGTTPVNDIKIVNAYPVEINDLDMDGIQDNQDNCPEASNPNQTDTDEDGTGDVCDSDLDGDGVENDNDAYPNDNSEHTDTDGDNIGDNADVDDDNDGLNDTDDAFPLDASETLDTDGDGIGNNGDADDDGDGVTDTMDNCQFVVNPDQSDADGDGIGTACDGDESSSSSESESVPSLGFVATCLCLLAVAVLSRRD